MPRRRSAKPLWKGELLEVSGVEESFGMSTIHTMLSSVS